MTLPAKKTTIANFLNNEAVKASLESTLGDKKGEFVSNLIALSDADKALQKCDPARLMKCAMNATALDLPLNKNLGFAYVIPYGDVPQFQIGYKGLIQLALRSGVYKALNVVEVREGELKFNKFTGTFEILGEFPENEIVAYVAYLKTLNGFEHVEYWTKEKVMAHAKKYSQSFAKWGKGLWKDDFDKMALKTVIKALLNTYGTLSVQLQKAITVDQSDGNGNYIDNQRDNEEEPEIQEFDIDGEQIKETEKPKKEGGLKFKQ